MKDLVKYHNDLNTISIKNWNAEEMNFFFGIISKIRDKGTKEMTLNTAEIKELINYTDRNYRWVATLDKVTDKIAGLRYVERTSKRIANFALFQRFIIDIENKTLNIKVSDDFEYIVNKLTKNFTVYELAEFTNLKSVYSKTMYRILKQRRTVGNKEIEIKAFRELLDIPKTYNISSINRAVIGPIRKELPQYFVNFKVKAIKANTQGTPVIAYRFTWTPEKVNAWDPNKYTKAVPYKKQTYKKKRYRSKDGVEVAKKISDRRREEYFKKVIEEKEQGQTGEEILEEMQNLNNKEQEDEI
jgi:plasmid replication initiation protein